MGAETLSEPEIARIRKVAADLRADSEWLTGELETGELEVRAAIIIEKLLAIVTGVTSRT